MAATRADVTVGFGVWLARLDAPLNEDGLSYR
jgi:hypothetical protein